MRLSTIIFGTCAAINVCAAYKLTTFSVILPGGDTSAGENCTDDGVCALPSTSGNKTRAATLIQDAVMQRENSVAVLEEEKGDDLSAEKVQQLVKMGWDESASRKSLDLSGGDLEKAAILLDEQEKEQEEIQELANELVSKGGWARDASESAVLQSNKNLTAASLMLEQEERIINENFDVAVKDMTANGWEEVVARQALLAQWTLDQRKAMGLNTTVPADILATIRPTLKKANETSTDKSKVPFTTILYHNKLTRRGC
jgi:hypothetical protein